MKTPLTELIETLEAMKEVAPMIQKSAYQKCIDEAKKKLPKEEEEIKAAWANAWLDWDDFSNSSDYFNSTYPQPTTTEQTDNN